MCSSDLFVVFALAAVFNDETITPQIVMFAAGVVATVAISTRTRGSKAPVNAVIPGCVEGTKPESRDSQMCKSTS